jgi:hypothetical protein
MENLARLLEEGHAEVVKTDYSSSPDTSQDEEISLTSSSEYNSEEENFIDNPLAFSCKNDEFLPRLKVNAAYVIIECLYENGIITEIDHRIFTNESEMKDYCIAMIEYYNNFYRVPYQRTDDLNTLIYRLISFAYEKDDCERKFNNIKIIKSIIKGNNVTIF